MQTKIFPVQTNLSPFYSDEAVPTSQPYVPPGRREQLREGPPCLIPRPGDRARFYPVPIKHEQLSEQQVYYIIFWKLSGYPFQTSKL